MSSRLSLSVAAMLGIACTSAPPPADPVAATAEPTAAEGGRCDAAALTEAAREIEAARAAVARSQPARAAEAIRTHCSSVLATGLDASLDRVLDPERPASGFPAYAEPGDESRLACARIDEVATAATYVAGPDRPAAVYDGCDLQRFASVVSREEFIAARVQTGGVTMLALGEHLRRAGVPASTADTLTHELVLASGY
jgi:hypothetical protein